MQPFKVVVAGGRDFNDFPLMCKTLDNLLHNQFDVTIISGGAKGADKLGELYAEKRGFALEVMKAEWDKYGKAAGYRRNAEMCEATTAVVCFWDGTSRGTKHMMDTTNKANKPLRVIRY